MNDLSKCIKLYITLRKNEVKSVKGNGCVMAKVSASPPRDRGFEPQMGHDHDSSFGTSTGWFQEADWRMI